MKLSKLYPHPRDAFIKFYDEGHIYKIKGVQGNPISVTTLVGKFWDKFDPEIVSGRIVKSSKMTDPNYQYYGKTQQEIKDLWKSNKAAQLGTDMHESIEYFYNGELNKYPETHEFGLFLKFESDFKKYNSHYVPFRTEWVVFDAQCKIAGSIDMTYVNADGEIVIYDWKRVDKLDDCFYNKKGKGPLMHLRDTKYNHYAIQLNCYRYILETCYGKKVVGMYLGVFHPNNDEYIVRVVPRMEKEIIDIWSTIE